MEARLTITPFPVADIAGAMFCFLLDVALTGRMQADVKRAEDVPSSYVDFSVGLSLDLPRVRSPAVGVLGREP